MRVLIYEPAYRGHRLNYVRLITPALLRLGANALIATSAEAIESEEWKIHIGPISEDITIDASLEMPNGNLISNARHRARDLTAIVNRHRPDWILIPYADGIAQAIGLSSICGRRPFPSNIPVEGLQLRGKFAYPQSSLRKHLHSEVSWRLAMAFPWRRLHQLDPIVYDNLLLRRPSLTKRINIMPDPISAQQKIDRESARKELNLETDGLLCGCVGGLDTRKGIDHLIKVFASAKLRDTRLLLAGRVGKTIHSLLNGPFAKLVKQKRIIVLDRYISDLELDLSIAAMDLVCTPYPRHIGSASIVIRAAAAGRPVLGSEYGWIGWAVQHFKLGATCDITNHDLFSETLKTAIEFSQTYEQSDIARRFVNFHTPENFQAVWTQEIAAALGARVSNISPGWDDICNSDADQTS